MPRRRTRTRPRPSAAIVALAAACLLAGCGGGDDGPRLARADVAPLITLADRIPIEGACAQARDIRQLVRLRLALVRAHRVPAALLESLSSGVNALAEETPSCLPSVTADNPTSPPPPPPPPVTTAPREHGHGVGHGDHEHKQKHGHGHDGGDD